MSDVANCFLIVIKFDPMAQNPLGGGSLLDKADRLALSAADGLFKPFLVVGLVDRQQRKVNTPVVQIQLEGEVLETYNGILDKVSDLNAMYYVDPNYVENPSRFSEAEKRRVSDRIDSIGFAAYHLLYGDSSNVLRTWLDSIFKPQSGRNSAGGAPTRFSQHVTILTNDFSIPWAWLKPSEYKPMLCEVCSVGTLQLHSHLQGPQATTDPVWREKVRRDEIYKALIINGTPELPCVELELAAVKATLTKKSARTNLKTFEVVDVASLHDLSDVKRTYGRGQRTEQFRVVHFTGHFSSQSLLVNGEPIDEKDWLDPIVDGAVLVLDGCSSSRGLRAWADANTTTARLIGLGASGCIVTQLPLKNDPIVAEVFWGEFYKEIRANASVGQALGKARAKLREHFFSLGSKNPAWALYQLIGNPSVQILETAEADGEDGR